MNDKQLDKIAEKLAILVCIFGLVLIVNSTIYVIVVIVFPDIIVVHMLIGYLNWVIVALVIFAFFGFAMADEEEYKRYKVEQVNIWADQVDTGKITLDDFNRKMELNFGD